MKQAFFWKLAIATNICFLFLVVHKSSQSIQASYDQQKLVQEKNILLHRQEELTHTIYALKSLTSVKRYAQHELGMKPCTLKQVKQLATMQLASMRLASMQPVSTHRASNEDNQPPVNDGVVHP